jgi:hypothetical protein
MPTISILHRNELKLTCWRIELYLNGKSIGYLDRGKCKTLDLPTGEHRLNVKSRWYRSRDLKFTLFNKENKSFLISTNTFLIRPLAILGLIDALLVIFGRNHHPENKFILIFKTVGGLLFILMIIYYLTIGRSNYLIIKEKSTELKDQIINT